MKISITVECDSYDEAVVITKLIQVALGPSPPLTDDEPDNGQVSAIRALRKERGLTQAELAAIVGTSKAMISHIENGARRLKPSLESRIFSALQDPRFDEQRPLVTQEEA